MATAVTTADMDTTETGEVRQMRSKHTSHTKQRRIILSCFEVAMRQPFELMLSVGCRRYK
jgi:hypothetical protein